MNDPSREQADALAMLLWAGVSAGEAIPFVAPAVDAAIWPELTKRWPRSKPVLDAQVRLQGGPWTTLTDEQRRTVAIDRAHRCQAWVLASQHPSELNAAERVLWKEALASLERVQAGTAGKHDMAAEIWAKALEKTAREKKTPSTTTEQAH